MRRPMLYLVAVLAVAAVLFLACRQMAVAEEQPFAPVGFVVVGSYLEGAIENTGDTVRKDVTVTITATSTDERQIYWQQTVRLGDIGPGERARVRVRYGVGAPKPEKLLFEYGRGEAPEPQQRKDLFAFSGEGHGYSEWFALPAGEISFAYAFQASRNGTVQIAVEDESGAPALVVLDEVMAENAATEGVKSLTVQEPAQYRLNVAAEGLWEVDITQAPAAGSGPAAAEEKETRQQGPSSVRIREDDSGLIIITR